MNAEIIIIGDEILIGQVIDSNSAFICEELNKIGILINRITSIHDNKNDIFIALNNAIPNTDLIIITGGLGPTNDDITKSSLVEYFNTKLVFNENAFERIKGLLKSRSVKISDLNKKQAELPENCISVPNNCGTASGMWFTKNNTQVISIPGVPYEMKEMMINSIIPELKIKNDLPPILHKTVITTGIPESLMAKMLEKWEAQLPQNCKLAYLPSPGRLRLRLTISGESESIMKKVLIKQIELLNDIIGLNIIGYNDDSIEEVLGKLLKDGKRTISVAESCTGGKISELITSVPGSSEYFKGAVIAYSNEIKKKVLGVKKNILMEYGAVSRQVVEEMAKGMRELYNTDYAIATSGVAGPTGGSEKKPVGTTWIAIATSSKTISKKYNFGEHRGRNVLKASLEAMFMLFKEIKN